MAMSVNFKKPRILSLVAHTTLLLAVLSCFTTWTNSPTSSVFTTPAQCGKPLAGALVLLLLGGACTLAVLVLPSFFTRYAETKPFRSLVSLLAALFYGLSIVVWSGGCHANLSDEFPGGIPEHPMGRSTAIILVCMMLSIYYIVANSQIDEHRGWEIFAIHEINSKVRRMSSIVAGQNPSTKIPSSEPASAEIEVEV